MDPVSVPRKGLNVAVVGAGLSGLACALSLQRAGLAVQVFDKSRGPSGRMSTRRGEGWQSDHGAQYFTARDPVFRAEVQAWEDAGVAARWSPRLAVYGAPPHAPADQPTERWVGTPRMTAPAQWLAGQLAGPLRLEHTVQALRHGHDGRWRLSTQEHGELPDGFDHVLLAVPSVQAVPLLQPVHEGWARLASAARMRGSWALMVRAEPALSLPFDAAFVNGGALRWVACDSSKPGRPATQTWLLHSEAEWSDAHLEDDPEEVAHILWHALGDRLVAHGHARPPELGQAGLSHSIHRWRYADTAPPLGQEAAWCVRTGLGLCGDWLGTGKVEGAWLSGRALAAQVLASSGT